MSRTTVDKAGQNCRMVPAADAVALPHDRDSTTLVTAREVAAQLRLPLKSVYHLVETREIPFVRIGRRVRFVTADVIKWLAKHRVPSLEDQ